MVLRATRFALTDRLYRSVDAESLHRHVIERLLQSSGRHRPQRLPILRSHRPTKPQNILANSDTKSSPQRWSSGLRPAFVVFVIDLKLRAKRGGREKGREREKRGDETREIKRRQREKEKQREREREGEREDLSAGPICPYTRQDLSYARPRSLNSLARLTRTHSIKKEIKHRPN